MLFLGSAKCAWYLLTYLLLQEKLLYVQYYIWILVDLFPIFVEYVDIACIIFEFQTLCQCCVAWIFLIWCPHLRSSECLVIQTYYMILLLCMSAILNLFIFIFFWRPHPFVSLSYLEFFMLYFCLLGCACPVTYSFFASLWYWKD